MNIKEYISSGIIESYILGFASPEEASILECVMKNNLEVKLAFEEAQKTLEDLATIQTVTPPDDLKSKIWNKIQQEQTVESNLSGITTDINEVRNESDVKIRKINSWKIITVAAAVLLLFSLAANIFWMNVQSKNEQHIAELQRQKDSQNLALKEIEQKLDVSSNPNMLKIVLAGVEKHPDSKAIVYWDKSTKNVYLSATNLPKKNDGMQYQLWAIVEGKPVNAGMYSEDKDSKTVLSNIPNAQAFAITLEKDGGSTVPTMENMVVIGNM